MCSLRMQFQWLAALFASLRHGTIGADVLEQAALA
jgi:hypothetical protein